MQSPRDFKTKPVIKRVPAAQRPAPRTIAELDDFRKHACDKPMRCTRPVKMPVASDGNYDYHWCDHCYKMIPRRKNTANAAEGS
jgi:hypothetical protein